MVDLMPTNTESKRKISPHEYYGFCEWHHKKLLSRSKESYELYYETHNEYHLDEASDAEWQAAEFSLDNQSFIQAYQKENPEITYKFFKDSND